MRKLFAFAALALPVGAACSDPAPPPTSDASASAGPAQVAIDTFRFTPGRVEVVAGESVRFANNDAVLHTATSPEGGFDLQLPDKGTSATHTFATPGTFRYVCTRHPGMAGEVVVR